MSISVVSDGQSTWYLPPSLVWPTVLEFRQVNQRLSLLGIAVRQQTCIGEFPAKDIGEHNNHTVGMALWRR